MSADLVTATPERSSRHLGATLLLAAVALQGWAIAWLQPGANAVLPWQAALCLSVLLCLAAWSLQRRTASRQSRAEGSVTRRCLDAAAAEAAAEQRARSGDAEHLRTIERLSRVAEHNLALTVISDRQDRVVWANDAFCNAMGWTLQALMGQAVGPLLSDQTTRPQTQGTPLSAATGADAVVDHRMQEVAVRSRDGRDLWLAVERRPLPRHGAQGGGHVWLCIDHSARMHQQSKLRALWSALPVGVLVHDAQGRIVDANAVAERLLGDTAAALQLRDPADPRWQALDAQGQPLSADDHPVGRTLAHGAAVPPATIGIHTPAGDLKWLRWHTEAQTDPQRRLLGVVSCFVDIDDPQRVQGRLDAREVAASAHAAIADGDTERENGTDNVSGGGSVDGGRTGLPTRACALDRIARALTHLRRSPGYAFAVLCVQIVLPVEPTVSPQIRAAALRRTAARLQQLMRPGDALACGAEDPDLATRSGCDTFALVLDGVHDAAAVQAIADRLLQDLAAPWLTRDGLVMLDVHLGATLCRDAPPTLTAADVLRQADLAVHDAEQAGAPQWRLHDDSTAARVVRQQALHSDLRRAHEDGELTLVYQPIVALQTPGPGAEIRKVIGVEALLRWQHPQRGLLPALDFIDAAEGSGVLDAMSDGLLHQACTQFMRWQQALGNAAPARLAVNLSALQLSRHGLAAAIEATLSATGMAPTQLQIEIGDAALARAAAIELQPLRDAGLQLVLDDFGSDGASLARLQQAPLDGVKIDGSFVSRSTSSEAHRLLVEAIVNLAHQRGLLVVAEGIESDEARHLMAQIGCDAGQGHAMGWPLPAAGLTAWLQGRPGRSAVDGSSDAAATAVADPSDAEDDAGHPAARHREAEDTV